MVNTLIMELTLEQGGGREKQVQPPINVWAHYFEIDFEALPTFVLQDRKHPSSGLEHRPVVGHDHNWTVEIGDAGLPRPAILYLERTGVNSFDYWVYRPGDFEFDHVEWLLIRIHNPYRTTGRRWMMF